MARFEVALLGLLLAMLAFRWGIGDAITRKDAAINCTLFALFILRWLIREFSVIYFNMMYPHTKRWLTYDEIKAYADATMRKKKGA